MFRFAWLKKRHIDDNYSMIKKHTGTEQLVNVYLTRKSNMEYRVIVGCRINDITGDEITLQLPKDPTIYRLGYEFEKDLKVLIKDIKSITIYEPTEFYNFPHRDGF